MKDKLGLYIENLMLIIKDKDQTPFVRELALDDLKEVSQSISSFIFEHIDDIEELSFQSTSKEQKKKAEKLYEEYWTCAYCDEQTNEVEYDYLSGTDHLECALRYEKELKTDIPDDEDERNARMDIVGQNGPTGTHYEEIEKNNKIDMEKL